MSNLPTNIGYECTRRQCEIGKGDQTALRWIHSDLSWKEYTFQGMEVESNRFANLLTTLGAKRGDIFFVFFPKLPEIYFAVLGALKAQVVVSVLFNTFGEDALLDRLVDSQAKIVFTHQRMFRKIRNILPQLTHLEKIVVMGLTEPETAQVVSFERWYAETSDHFEILPTPADTPSVLHYTSGSTGKPKGVLHVHGSLPYQVQTFTEILQVQPGDTFWCTADPAWVTGTTYGIIAPWSQGVTQIQFEGGYSAEAWFHILEEHQVNVWYTAPTALRMLMREDEALYATFPLKALRSISSVGEPLNPEVIYWARRVLKHEIYDTWFQTETGAIMISNRPGLPVKPGSMGIPAQGIQAAIIQDDGSDTKIREQGNLCVQPGWSSMFVAYLNHNEVYQQKFRYGYYFSGDLAYQDEEGYFWFIGRSDDVINTAGHLVSPFEVESALLEISEIAEAGVVAAPDDILFEKVVAFVVLKPKVTWSAELDLKVKKYISNRVSTIAAPQDIQVIQKLPKNKSGKILRRVLKARYSGSDAGDLTTLEEF